MKCLLIFLLIAVSAMGMDIDRRLRMNAAMMNTPSDKDISCGPPEYCYTVCGQSCFKTTQSLCYEGSCYCLYEPICTK
ncbi:hypothetical protein B5X24_HaOG214293 [Helicoverpa armigera]|nr:hypothetical protein B5X24_HaOG214293 [Helicoverpa armigera]